MKPDENTSCFCSPQPLKYQSNHSELMKCLLKAQDLMLSTMAEQRTQISRQSREEVVKLIKDSKKITLCQYVSVCSDRNFNHVGKLMRRRKFNVDVH